MAKAKPVKVAADAQAAALLERAAEAAGCSVAELAKLALAATALAPPEKSAELFAGEPRTLREVGESLYRKLPGLGDGRQEFVAGLTKQQREVLILWLCERGFSPPTIATQLDLQEGEVRSLWMRRNEDLGRFVQSLNLQAILGSVQARYEACTELALAQGDHKAAMQYEKDRVALLQSLGIVEQVVQRHAVEVTHKLEQGMEAELDRILELRARTASRDAAWRKWEEQAQDADSVALLEESK